MRPWKIFSINHLKFLVTFPVAHFYETKQTRKLIQRDLQSNFNSFSEMDSGACKEINADFAPV